MPWTISSYLPCGKVLVGRVYYRAWPDIRVKSIYQDLSRNFVVNIVYMLVASLTSAANWVINDLNPLQSDWTALSVAAEQIA